VIVIEDIDSEFALELICHQALYNGGLNPSGVPGDDFTVVRQEEALLFRAQPLECGRVGSHRLILRPAADSSRRATDHDP
jgi:hypothetical protein